MKSPYLKAAICGFLAGDGSVQVRKEKNFYHYQLDFFPDDEEMLKTYMDAIKYIYNKVPSIRRRDNVFIVRITSKVIVQDILRDASFGIKTWSLPNNLFGRNTPTLWVDWVLHLKSKVPEKRGLRHFFLLKDM